MKYEKGKEDRIRDNVWLINTGYMRTTKDKFAYNDVLEEIHLALSSVYDKRDDNEIYTFRSQIDNNLMSNQISK